MRSKPYIFGLIILLQLLSSATVQADSDPGDIALYESEKFVLGVGPAIVKFDTKVKASVLTKKFECGIVKVDDVWYTKDWEVHPAKQKWIEALTHSGYEQLDQMSSGFRSKITGPILKQNTVLQTTDYKKNEVDKYIENVRAVSLKELKSSEIPEATF